MFTVRQWKWQSSCLTVHQIRVKWWKSWRMCYHVEPRLLMPLSSIWTCFLKQDSLFDSFFWNNTGCVYVAESYTWKQCYCVLGQYELSLGEPWRFACLLFVSRLVVISCFLGFILKSATWFLLHCFSFLIFLPFYVKMYFTYNYRTYCCFFCNCFSN